jgi:hypothetical protein
MTNEQQKIRAIAEYDGWKPTGKFNRAGSEVFEHFEYGTKSFQCFLDDSSYRYDINLNNLHPVAMKVILELSALDIFNTIISDMRNYYLSKIRKYCAVSPIDNQYIDLFNAVYEGIQFINQHKK